MKCALVRPGRHGAPRRAASHPGRPRPRGGHREHPRRRRRPGRPGARGRPDPVAAGVAVPGVVDEETGIAVWSSNVGFRDVPLRDLVVRRGSALPAALGHDVRAGGMAEARLGAGRDQRHVLFIAIGTGIAAAHVVDGKAFAGAHGAAGEVGHVDRPARRPAVRLRRPRLPGVGRLGLGDRPPVRRTVRHRRRGRVRRGRPRGRRRAAGHRGLDATPSRRWPTACSPRRRSTTPGSWCSAAGWPRPARRCSPRCAIALDAADHLPPDAAAGPGRARRHGRLPRRRPAGPRPTGAPLDDPGSAAAIVRPGAVVPGHVEVDGPTILDGRRRPADAGDDVIVPGLRRPALPRRRRAHVHHRATPTRPARRPPSTCGTAPRRCWPAWSARRTS